MSFWRRRSSCAKACHLQTCYVLFLLSTYHEERWIHTFARCSLSVPRREAEMNPCLRAITTRGGGAVDGSESSRDEWYRGPPIKTNQESLREATTRRGKARRDSLNLKAQLLSAALRPATRRIDKQECLLTDRTSSLRTDNGGNDVHEAYQPGRVANTDSHPFDQSRQLDR